MVGSTHKHTLYEMKSNRETAQHQQQQQQPWKQQKHKTITATTTDQTNERN